jgi:hypothetical protein
MLVAGVPGHYVDAMSCWMSRLVSLISVATLLSHILPKGSSRRMRAIGRVLPFPFVSVLILTRVALGPDSSQVSPSSQVTVGYDQV